MDMLLDTEVKSLSLGALQQYNLDLVQCERKFAWMIFFFL